MSASGRPDGHRRAPDPVFRHRSRRSVRGDRKRDHRGRRLRLAQAAAAAGAGKLLEGRAAGAGAPARRRPARRRHRRLGAARAGAAQQRGAGLCRHRHQRLCRALGARPRHRPRASSREIEALARELGLVVLNLDLRDTQRAAIGLYESLGYRRWGTHPCYAQVEGRIVPGHYYYKRLDEPATPVADCRDPVPRDRSEGRRLRPPRARRDGERHRVQRRPGGAGARLRRSRVSLAACRRSRRRLCRAVGQWRRRCGRSAARSICGSSSAAASATAPRSMTGSALGIDRVVLGTAALRDPELVRRAAADHPGPHRRRHRCARRPRRGRGLGRDQRRSSAVELGAAFRRCRGGGDRLHRHRPRRRADRGRRGGDRRLRARRSACRSSPRAASPRSPTSRR